MTARPFLACMGALWAPLLLLGATQPPSPPVETPSPPLEDIDPGTLVVPPPSRARTRDPSEDVNQLLRTELSILEAVQELDMNVARRTSELARLEHQEKVVEADLLTMTEQFDALSDRLDQGRRVIKRRLRAMIQLQRTEPYQVLFSSEDHVSYLRRQRGLKALVGADQQRVASYRTQLAKWREARDDLMRRRANLQRTRQTISSLVEQLTVDREEKSLLLEAVRNRAAFHAKLGQEMKAVDRALRKKVVALRNERHRGLRFEKNFGKMMMPIWKGRVVGRFGIRENRRFGTRTVHRGLDLVPEAWREGKPINVRSIYWGYVAYAGWLKGLGKTVIVDHTRGYMSLYAHLDEVFVEDGEKVKTGSKLGMMGDTGSLHGPRLYLEIRREGRAIDPKPWLR